VEQKEEETWKIETASFSIPKFVVVFFPFEQ